MRCFKLKNKTHRLAAIDIGTVTTRLLIADVCGTEIVPVVRDMRITHLGEGFAETGSLSKSAMKRVFDAVASFQDEIGRRGVDKTIAIATSASRDAKNSSEFVEILAGSGLRLSVIPGSKEAELSFLGAASQFLGEDRLVVDIGGGSTEVVLGSAVEGEGFVDVTLMASHSFDIGCRRMTDAFIRSDPPTSEEMEKLRTEVLSQMRPYFGSFKQMPQMMIAVAGTATTVVSVSKRMESYDSDEVHGTVVTRETLRGISEDLATQDLASRKKVIGLEPDRAGVIVAGMVTLECVLELSGLDSFTVSESDILQGILLDAARSL